MAHTVQIDALDILKHHQWKIQALIARRWSDSKFVVLIQPMFGEDGFPEPGAAITKEFVFDNANEAYKHARSVLGFAASF